MNAPRPASTLALVCSSLMLATLMATGAPPAHAQNTPADVAADLRMAQESERYRSVADTFVARAQSGDVDGTLAMLSKALVDRTGEAQIRQALQTQIVPFFQRAGSGAGTARSVTVSRTTDANGQRGFAFYMWLSPRDAGVPRPYTVYVVAENGQPVVATAIVDRRVEGRHQ